MNCIPYLLHGLILNEMVSHLNAHGVKDPDIQDLRFNKPLFIGWISTRWGFICQMIE